MSAAWGNRHLAGGALRGQRRIHRLRVAVRRSASCVKLHACCVVHPCKYYCPAGNRATLQESAAAAAGGSGGDGSVSCSGAPSKTTVDHPGTLPRLQTCGSAQATNQESTMQNPGALKTTTCSPVSCRHGPHGHNMGGLQSAGCLLLCVPLLYSARLTLDTALPPIINIDAYRCLGIRAAATAMAGAPPCQRRSRRASPQRCRRKPHAWAADQEANFLAICYRHCLGWAAHRSCSAVLRQLLLRRRQRRPLGCCCCLLPLARRRRHCCLVLHGFVAPQSIHQSPTPGRAAHEAGGGGSAPALLLKPLAVHDLGR